MIFAPEAATSWARAERGVHAASAFKMKAGWHVLALDRFGH